MEAHGIGGIDLVYVNLYPFESTIAGGADYATAIENIDIGGPAMIRSAAKNHAYVAVCTEPADLQEVLDALAAEGATRLGLRQLQGKELSYNNINDTDAAFELIAEFDPGKSPACAIIKHANPCGVATGATLLEAYERALACDPTSAFGGIVALNSKLDAATAA